MPKAICKCKGTGLIANGQKVETGADVEWGYDACPKCPMGKEMDRALKSLRASAPAKTSVRQRRAS
jgi:hypothetical protein